MVRSRGVIEPVFVERVDELAESLRAVLHDGDVVLTMGAGSIGATWLMTSSRDSRRGRPHERFDAHGYAANLAPEFNARVLYDVPMSKHTSWHAGGPADAVFHPAGTVMRSGFVHEASCRPAGSGPVDRPGFSNLLVRDGGIRGVVVSTHGTLDALERKSETRIVRAEAGVACAQVLPGNASSGAWDRLSSSPASPAPWVARSP